MGILNIPPTVDELRLWSQEYEKQHMVPSKMSGELAQIAMTHFKRCIPNIPGLRRLVSSLFICLMDDRLRTAMMLPAQTTWAHFTVRFLCGARAMFIRNWCLPSLKPKAYIALENPPSGIGPDGRMRLYTLVRQYYPWYYPIPRGFRAVYDQATGWSKGFYPSAAFKAQEYRIEELGPQRYEEDGHARVFSEAERMQGAPIGPPWAR